MRICSYFLALKLAVREGGSSGPALEPVRFLAPTAKDITIMQSDVDTIMCPAHPRAVPDAVAKVVQGSPVDKLAPLKWV